MPNVSMRSWWREPLLHFALLGALIFAADRAMGPSVDESRVITIGSDLIEELTSEFAKGRGRSPSAAELDWLIETWLRDELLYREGLALGVDRGDPMIRERAIHKMRLVVFNSLVIEEPTEEQLRRWFEANRHRYSKPQRFSFVLARLRGSEINGRSDAQKVVQAVNNWNKTSNKGPRISRAEGDGQESLPEVQVKAFHERPRSNVVGLFGEGFAEALQRQPVKEWHILEGKDRWHAVRLEKLLPPVVLEYDAVRSIVENDWRAAERRRLAREAVAKIRQSYVIRREQET